MSQIANNILNGEEVGAVVGHLTPNDLEDLILHARKVNPELLRKLLMWYKDAVQDQTYFTVILTEPRDKYLEKLAKGGVAEK
jgi:hypothetical protein